MFVRTGVLASEEDIYMCLPSNTTNNVFVAATQIPRFGLQQPGELECYGVIVGFSESADSVVAAGARTTMADRYKITEYIRRIYSVTSYNGQLWSLEYQPRLLSPHFR